nr:hypothetical protein GCM10020063_005640 [Dactylosporangium thailandense]
MTVMPSADRLAEIVLASRRSPAGSRHEVDRLVAGIVAAVQDPHAVADEDVLYLAFLLSHLGHRTAGRRLADALIATRSQDLDRVAARLTKSLMLVMDGDLPAAKMTLLVALRETPAGDSPYRYRILVNLATVSLRAGQVDEAARWLGEAAEAAQPGTTPVADAVLSLIRQVINPGESPGRAADLLAALEMPGGWPSAPELLMLYSAASALEWHHAQGASDPSATYRAMLRLERAAQLSTAAFGPEDRVSIAAVGGAAVAEFEYALAHDDLAAATAASARLAFAAEAAVHAFGDGHPQAAAMRVNAATAAYDLAHRSGDVSEMSSRIGAVRIAAAALERAAGVEHRSVAMALANLAAAEVDLAQRIGSRPQAVGALAAVNHAWSRARSAFGADDQTTLALGRSAERCALLVAELGGPAPGSSQPADAARHLSVGATNVAGAGGPLAGRAGGESSQRRRQHDPEPLLTPAEVSTMFRVDPKTITRWAKAGKLSAIRTLGGHRRYRESEVRALLQGQIPTMRPEDP